jgi:hypothetical protein
MKRWAIIAATLGSLPFVFFSSSAQARSVASQRVCLQSGSYAVFAQHPLFFGAWNVQGLLNYWLPPELRRVPRSSLGDVTNTELAHEHIFFCDNGTIVDNVGFGPEGRFQYSQKSLDTGKEPNGSRVDNFVPLDRERYNSNIVRSILRDSPAILPTRCVLQGDGKYLGIGHNCQNFTEKIRNEYWRKMFTGTWQGVFPCGPGQYILQYEVEKDYTLVQTVVQHGGNNCLPNGHKSTIGQIPRNLSKGSAFTAIIYLGTGSQTRSAPIKIIDANTFEFEGTVLRRVAR